MASGKKSNASGSSPKRGPARRSIPRFAVCIENGLSPASLELHKVYRILPDEEAAGENHLRVVDESREDYLYPAKWFVAVEVPRLVERSLLAKR